MNEEAEKKNTDCVYFLASPLTCKKGNDCEFRHSESARNNPRDCWYWLSRSCLNANCAFRHPPLEAIPEGELAAGGRSRVPCYYFMQGYCAKGDKCIFMHGLPTASVAEVPQKVSKFNATKTEVPDNQTSANKGTCSATSKASFEFYEPPAEAPSQNLNQITKDVDVHVTNRLPEGSDSSAPARYQPSQSYLSDRSKQVPPTNGRLKQTHSSNANFLHQEGQTEGPLCDFQPADDRVGQDPSGEDQIHEGSESEEMWEESSFDVLVDDGGTDQLIYADDLDYLNQYDSLVDQLTGGADGFADFDYDSLGAYGQYYDAEYELATYDAFEQRLVYDQVASFDPEDGMQPVVMFKNRQGKDMLPRVRREVTFDGEVRSQRVNVGSNDLRNHIVKRRRAEKNHKYGEDHNRRRHQGNGSQHNRRHQDGHFKQQEGPGRRHLSPKSGSRLSRQYPGRGESPRGRQIHGRFVELSGTKRSFRDFALDHEETAADRDSSKKFSGMIDAIKSKSRKERGRPAITGVDEALGSRGQQQSKKVESMKEDSTFTGPKSLAQIKAEKMKAIQDGVSTVQHDYSNGRNGSVEELCKTQSLQMRSKISPHLKELAKPATRMESNFEGPKPLSVILRQKRRGESEGEAREEVEEKSCGTGGARVGLKSTSFFASERGSSVTVPYTSADSLVVYDQNKGRIPRSIHDGLRKSGEKKSQLHSAANLATFSTTTRDHQEVGMHPDKAVNPVFDTEDGLDMGGSVMEDVDFEDDDEDDFAKQLGGFLS